jgi:hypothetical protein
VDIATWIWLQYNLPFGAGVTTSRPTLVMRRTPTERASERLGLAAKNFVALPEITPASSTIFYYVKAILGLTLTRAHKLTFFGLSMAVVSLLVNPTDGPSRAVYSFEHAMAHRLPQQQMGPLSQWSVLPYWIDPQDFQAAPANKWNLNHQQAHLDFRKVSPAGPWAGAYPAAPGIPTSQLLMDTDLKSPGAVAWTTFANHQEHYIINNAILPYILSGTVPVQTPPLPPWQAPWWFQSPRYVPNAW